MEVSSGAVHTHNDEHRAKISELSGRAFIVVDRRMASSRLGAKEEERRASELTVY